MRYRVKLRRAVEETQFVTVDADGVTQASSLAREGVRNEWNRVEGGVEVVVLYIEEDAQSAKTCETCGWSKGQPNDCEHEGDCLEFEHWKPTEV